MWFLDLILVFLLYVRLNFIAFFSLFRIRKIKKKFVYLVKYDVQLKNPSI